ncbi:hypothetical protein L596_005683 [Steinernema carpocapsae]|uniref:Uncharacterized protein n=1 Tax=Steinernema carpocapsae TaxID=34508 RepID=A0A4U8V565_STECR|nr:hypothetical protein L596_005683 [Steinernema carpocapsae]
MCSAYLCPSKSMNSSSRHLCFRSSLQRPNLPRSHDPSVRHGQIRNLLRERKGKSGGRPLEQDPPDHGAPVRQLPLPESVPFFHVCQTEDVVSLLFSVLIPESVTHTTVGTPDQPFIDAFGRNLQQTVTRSVMDMMKNILFNDIYTTSGSKSETLFDALIDNIAESGRLRRCQCVVFSDISVQFMDHIMLSDICASTSSSINAPPSFPPSVPCQPVLANVFARLLYISSRLVDAVWSGLYVNEPIAIFQFLLKIAKSLRRADSKSAWDSMYNSISRIVLYLLSRPIDCVAVQMSVLDTLTECVQNQRIVLSPGFNDPMFYGALVHLIFMLSVTPDINSNDGVQSQLNRASAQVAMYATRVWQELCHSKKVLLEEIFKTGFVLEINAARALLSHLASQYWSQFVDSQVQTNSRTILPKFSSRFNLKFRRWRMVYSGLPVKGR